MKDYWEDRLRENWGLHGVGMLLMGKNYNQWMYKVRAVVFKRIIVKLNISFQSATILDVGCGTGFYINQWMQFKPKEIVGVDIAPVAVSRLQQEFPQFEFKQINIAKDIGILEENSFDLISTMDVMFHILDDQDYHKAFSNMHALLREKGILIFSENFLHGPTKRHQNYWASRPLAAIEKILQENGFNILFRRPMFYLMASPVDSQNEIYPKLWLRLSELLYGREHLGFLAGGILYPLEILLTSVFTESPSTEIMVCIKSK